MMTNIHNPPNDQKPSTPPLGNVDDIFSILLLLSGDVSIFGGPEKTGITVKIRES